ncbi:MAG TPA: hypothetical protein VF384_19335 [Planctomycetota bacterium]
MEIPNASESGGVERCGDSPAASQSSEPTFLIPRGGHRVALTPQALTVARFAIRARNRGVERDVKVAIAAQKLARRELDGQAALEATAKRMLDAGFLGA